VISVALYEPEIPGNTGAVGRLCAATGTPLHLIGRLGFSLGHPAATRAMMDYREYLKLYHHVSWTDFRAATSPSRVWMLTTKGERSLWEADFRPDDVLLFGPESRGLPADLLAADPSRTLRIPLLPTARSLNLSTAVAITLFEALRQTGWRP
jgi:tRNA (cytidine/uridine-2'-O-)-methyltransferase